MKTRILIVLGLLLALGCGEDATGPEPPAGPLVSQQITVSGGTLPVPGQGVRLVFPAGAVTQDTEISVFRASNAPSDVIGDALRFEPDGVQFNAPVQMVFDYDSNLPAGVLPDDVRVVTREGSRWVDVATNLVSGSLRTGSVMAELEHFSDYAVVIVDPAQTLRGTFGFAPDDAYIYAAGAIYRHEGGSTVNTSHTASGSFFLDGWGSSVGDHYAVGFVGTAGRIWHSTDGTGVVWNAESVPTGAAQDAAFAAIDGDGNTICAVGYGGRISYYDGSWSDESFVVPGGAVNDVRNLNAVACVPGGSAIAVGNEIVLTRNGGIWTETDMSSLFGSSRFFLHGIWARAADDVYAVGWEFTGGNNVGVVLHYNGAWSRETLPAGPYPGLQGVWGDDDEVYAVGRQGTVLEYDGTWTDETNGTCVGSTTFYDVWAMAPTSFHVVGGLGTLALPGTGCLTVNPGNNNTGGGGDIVIDLTSPPVDVCNQTWVDQGVTLAVVDTEAPDGDRCFVPACEFYTYDGMRLLCSRLELNLGSNRFEYAKVEIDLEDQCTEQSGCARVYLYDEAGNIINQQLSASADFVDQTVTVINPTNVVVQKAVVLMTYGLLKEARFYEN